MGLLEPHDRGRRGVRRTLIDPAPIVIQSLAEATKALEAAAGREIMLLSAPEAGIYAGPGWWTALIEAARDAAPAARFLSVLDCGDDPGAAMAAIRAGAEAIVFTGRADVAERLTAIAEAAGCRMLPTRPCACG
jgi:DNA-binding NarL/FixJ family response regulator